MFFRKIKTYESGPWLEVLTIRIYFFPRNHFKNLLVVTPATVAEEVKLKSFPIPKSLFKLTCCCSCCSWKIHISLKINFIFKELTCWSCSGCEKKKLDF